MWMLDVLAQLPPSEKLQPYLPQLMQVRACLLWSLGTDLAALVYGRQGV
jgi:hypothetical protein